MSFRSVITMAVIVLLIVTGFLYFQNLQSNANNSVAVPTPTQSVQTITPTQGSQTQNTVTITANGFSPDNITIKAGDTVTWINSDTQNHQVASDPHPIHTLYPPLNNVGLLQPGEQKSLTFPDSGTHGYHDHLNPNSKGSVIIQ